MADSKEKDSKKPVEKKQDRAVVLLKWALEDHVRPDLTDAGARRAPVDKDKYDEAVELTKDA